MKLIRKCSLVCVIGILSGCQTPPDAPAPHQRLNQPQPLRKPPPAPLPMRTETIGHSVENRPIVVHTFGAGKVGTLVMAGIHGDESTSIVLAERLIFLLSRGELSDLTSAVAVIPVANPDGAKRGTRTNARRVDLNRNFPAKNWGKTRKGVYHGGTAALSEPETIAIQKAIQTIRPSRIVSIHSITRGRECNNYDGPAESLARRMAAHNGYPVTANIGYPTPGSFGSWAGIDLQIPVITLELPRDLPGELAWQNNRAALIEALRDLPAHSGTEVPLPGARARSR